MANRADCGKLMAIIKANYPAYHAKTDEETIMAAIGIMSNVLSTFSYQECEAALMKYMSEPHAFPPNPGQIKQQVEKVNRENKFKMIEKLDNELLLTSEDKTFIKLINDADDEVKAVQNLPEVVALANKFHRVKECGIVGAP